jgi:D-alanyl-D-alanine carboxypeptidase
MNKVWSHFNKYKNVYFIGVSVLTLSFLAGHSNKEVSSEADFGIFSEQELSAEAAIVIDDKTGDILYSKNSEEQFEIASITKLMTGLIAMEEMSDQYVYIDWNSFKSIGDTGLLINEKWRAEDLVSFMLVNSSNDAAEAIASTYHRGRERFIERMNDKARELSLGLVFKNPTGLNETDEFGGKGSAEDVASLLSYIYKKYPQILSGTVRNTFSISSENTDHVAENTNLFANSLLGLQASKTGYTNQSGGSLAVRFNIGLNRPVIAVVLGVDSRSGRFDDIKKIIKDYSIYLAN